MADDVLAEQIAYYRARAPEFDEWYERTGMYDLGVEWNARWHDEIAEVERALQAVRPSGRILDIASGTGIWTQRLVEHGTVTAVDASPEAIAIATERAPAASYVCADLFTWDTDERFDTIVFGFWLSHVPEAQFGWFWSRIDRWLADGGRVFFVDNLLRPLPIRDEERFWNREVRPDGIATRNLTDGREFKIVKHYYEPEELQARLRALGWDIKVEHTEWFFYYGGGGRG